MLALAVVSWPKYARLARSQTLALESADFIAAARLSGDSSVQLMVRHILPNIAGPILVTAVLDIGTMMMELAGLTFLGLGAMPPTAELGQHDEQRAEHAADVSLGHSWPPASPFLRLSPSFNLLGDSAAGLCSIPAPSR